MFGQSFRDYGPSISVFFLLAVFSSGDAAAQSTRTMDAAARRLDDFRKQSEKALHDDMAKDMKGRKTSPEDLKRAAAIKQQLRDDLESLQSEYNSLVTKLKSREPFTAAETAEIGERVYARSSRLAKNLNLPAPADAEQAQKSAENRSAPTIKDLCLKIFAFITHPMFETPSALDIRSSAEAKALLDEITWMSDVLRQAK